MEVAIFAAELVWYLLFLPIPCIYAHLFRKGMQAPGPLWDSPRGPAGPFRGMSHYR